MHYTLSEKPDFMHFILSRYHFILLMIVLITSGYRALGQEETRQAVELMIHKYPESTLQDIYKSFFQDEFGPGHLLSDTGAAKRYLEYELSEMTSRGNFRAEPCGAGNNFCRVPLDLVKDHIIPPDDFLLAFMESASSFKIPEMDQWRVKWNSIEKIIEKMNLNLDNFDADRSSLAEMMSRNEYVVHHSEAYTRSYDPHYRIMKKEQWIILENKYLKEIHEK